jgi:hypothetical protein
LVLVGRDATVQCAHLFAKRDFVELQTVLLGDPAKLDPALAKSL